MTEQRIAPVLDFRPSARLSIGIELELQVLSAHDFNLVRGAPDLLDLMRRIRHPGELKPEMTEGMIELNSSIHEHYRPLLAELRTTRDLLAKQAGRLNIAVCGGGTHAFHQWAEQRIFDAPRFRFLSDLYGYLAKQFTVFGQHIHIGCPNGDEAVRLTHGLARYVPHFIALSASSPFSQGVDTAFQSARLNAVSAFPLGGQMPVVPDWRHFNLYFGRMYEYGIVDSMKDFYWDMRPKPEYGTVEIRVCDTPLQVERAAQLAAYAQTLAFHLLRIDKEPPPRDIHLLYNYNRFQACRFGVDGNMIDARTQEHRSLRDDILATLTLLHEAVAETGNEEPLWLIREAVQEGQSDADRLRARYRESGFLPDVVEYQSELWMDQA